MLKPQSRAQASTSMLEQAQLATKQPCQFCLQTRMQLITMLQQSKSSVGTLMDKVMAQIPKAKQR